MQGQTKRMWAGVSWGLVVLLLASCGGQLNTQNPNNATYDNVLSVKLSQGDTASSLEARYGGKVLDWRPEAEYALLGLSQTAAEQFGVSNASVSIEPNNAKFLANGISTINGRSLWADGRSLWADGRALWADGRALWADGRFLPMPQNNTSLTQIRLEQGQRLAPNLGDGIEVAVIDTGIDLKHPAFVNALAPSSEWRDFVDGDRNPQERGGYSRAGYGHGTNVAGIILQVAPRAKILPIRVLSPDGSGTVANVAQAITYAVDAGADIINLSLGSDTSSEAISNAMIYAAQKGVLVVSSAGNDNRSTPNFPASIAQTSPSGTMASLYWTGISSVNAQGTRSVFANYGKEVELFAPGENMFGPAPENQLASWSGTSQAAPLASGAAALVLGERECISRFVGVQGLLLSMRSSSDGFLGNIPIDDALNSSGMGRLNLEKFLKNVLNPRP